MKLQKTSVYMHLENMLLYSYFSSYQDLLILSLLLQDITISIIFALLYFCFGTSMAVYADEWRHQEISYPVIFTIYSSLAAASVR